MKLRRCLAVVMTLFMLMSMLPTMVFASEEDEVFQLGGELKLKGTIEETAADGTLKKVIRPGCKLSADYTQVSPMGLTDEMVTFLWTQIDPQEVERQKDLPLEERQYTVLKELGKEKELQVTAEQVGYDIMLTITGQEDWGILGSIYMISDPVVTDEEQAELMDENPDETAIADIPVEDSGEMVIDDTAQIDPNETVIEDVPAEVSDDTADPLAAIFAEESTNTETGVTAELTDEATAELPGETPASDDSFYEAEDPDGFVITTSDSLAEDVPAAAEAEEPVYQLEIEKDKVDFETLEPIDQDSSYREHAQTVTVTNTGNTELTFDEITPEHFMVADIEEALEPADTVTLWVQPRAGLQPGTYVDTITYTSKEGATVSYEASVTIEDPAEADSQENAQAENTDGLVIEDPDATQADAQAQTEINGDAQAGEGEPETPVVEPTEPAEPTVPTEPTEPTDAGDNQAGEPIGPKLEFEDPSYTDIIFDQKENGYTEVPEAKTIIIKNTGDQEIKLAAPTLVNGYYEVVFDSNALTLAPDRNIIFTVRPITGLTAGDNADTLYFKAEGGTDPLLTTTLKFPVAEPTSTPSPTPTPEPEKLVSIQAPADITGVANGTAKDADRLGLPATVVITTTEGTQNASVLWDVQNSTYNAGSKSAQKFQVTGTVTLPDGIEQNGVSLTTAVNVSVDAYVRQPITVSAANNAITGILNGGEYQAQQGIKFQAVGAGMDNKDPQVGDQRYLPLNCTVVKTYTWESAPYEATIRLNNPGDYTLKVVFNLQEYTTNGWTTVSGAQDTKTVNFKIVNPNPTATATPTPSGKPAVATGDDSPIGPLVAVAVIALLAIGGIVIVRSRKK